MATRINTFAGIGGVEGSEGWLDIMSYLVARRGEMRGDLLVYLVYVLGFILLAEFLVHDGWGWIDGTNRDFFI